MKGSKIVNSESCGIGNPEAVWGRVSESFVIGGVHQNRGPGLHAAETGRQDSSDIRDAFVGVGT